MGTTSEQRAVDPGRPEYEVPLERPVVFQCAGGLRSSIAASLLRHTGRDDVSDLLGGYGAWLLLPEAAQR